MIAIIKTYRMMHGMEFCSWELFDSRNSSDDFQLQQVHEEILGRKPSLYCSQRQHYHYRTQTPYNTKLPPLQIQYYHHILHWRELSVLHNSGQTFQVQRVCGKVSGPNPPGLHYYIYQYRTHTTTTDNIQYRPHILLCVTTPTYFRHNFCKSCTTASKHRHTTAPCNIFDAGTFDDRSGGGGLGNPTHRGSSSQPQHAVYRFLQEAAQSIVADNWSTKFTKLLRDAFFDKHHRDPSIHYGSIPKSQMPFFSPPAWQDHHALACEGQNISSHFPLFSARFSFFIICPPTLATLSLADVTTVASMSNILWHERVEALASVARKLLLYYLALGGCVLE